MLIGRTNRTFQGHYHVTYGRTSLITQLIVDRPYLRFVLNERKQEHESYKHMKCLKCLLSRQKPERIYKGEMLLRTLRIEVLL